MPARQDGPAASCCPRAADAAGLTIMARPVSLGDGFGDLLCLPPIRLRRGPVKRDHLLVRGQLAMPPGSGPLVRLGGTVMGVRSPQQSIPACEEGLPGGILRFERVLVRQRQPVPGGAGLTRQPPCLKLSYPPLDAVLPLP